MVVDLPVLAFSICDKLVNNSVSLVRLNGHDHLISRLLLTRVHVAAGLVAGLGEDSLDGADALGGVGVGT